MLIPEGGEEVFGSWFEAVLTWVSPLAFATGVLMLFAAFVI